jgi:hypothetical protein
MSNNQRRLQARTEKQKGRPESRRPISDGEPIPAGSVQFRALSNLPQGGSFTTLLSLARDSRTLRGQFSFVIRLRARRAAEIQHDQCACGDRADGGELQRTVEQWSALPSRRTRLLRVASAGRRQDEGKNWPFLFVLGSVVEFRAGRYHEIKLIVLRERLPTEPGRLVLAKHIIIID